VRTYVFAIASMRTHTQIPALPSVWARQALLLDLVYPGAAHHMLSVHAHVRCGMSVCDWYKQSGARPGSSRHRTAVHCFFKPVQCMAAMLDRMTEHQCSCCCRCCCCCCCCCCSSACRSYSR